MRLSGGELGSRKIAAPRGRSVRPTPGRVKEALFSILGERVVGARVLDLYAGSGALGFEALSRGASTAIFVEANARTARAIRETAERLGLASRATLRNSRAERATAKLEGPFDIVFADPPYAAEPPLNVFAALADGKIDAHGILVYEHSARRAAPALDGYVLDRSAVYGEVALSFYRPIGVA